MSAYWFLENLWAYSVQFGAVALTALLLARLGRRAVPAARLAFLQAGLLAALAAPLLLVEAGPVVLPASIGIAVETSQADPPPPARRGVNPIEAALAVLGAGVVLRLAWTAIGLAALARRRRRARPLDGKCAELQQLSRRLGVEAELYAGAGGPVAFGLLRPAVLIPEALLAARGPALEAVLAHELVHLRRRDWLFVLGEELLLALLWFHPLAWLLIREIRLTREEAVDEQAAEAVAGTSDYLEALLAVARLRLQPVSVPGAEFLRDRQIARRIETLVRQESAMSRSLQYSLTLLSTFALLGAAWWVSSFSPLRGAPQAAAPSVESAESVSVAQGSEGLILPRRGLRYSPGALLARIEGDVTLELTLDAAGNVVDSRALSGPLELRQDAVRWSLDWRYDTSVQAARSVVATVSFRLPEREGQATFSLLGLSHMLETIDFPPGSLVLRSVDTTDLDPPNPALQAHLESYIGRDLAKEPSLAEALHFDTVRLTEAGESYRAPLAVLAPRADGAVLLVRRSAMLGGGVVGGGVVGGVGGGVGAGAGSTAAPIAKPSSPPPVPKRIKVGGGVQRTRLIRQVQPQYPALARQARIQGTVKLEALLDHEGAVSSIDVLSGHPLLIPAAIDAVKQWRYRPTLLNGTPVEVTTEIDVTFSLPAE